MTGEHTQRPATAAMAQSHQRTYPSVPVPLTYYQRQGFSFNPSCPRPLVGLPNVRFGPQISQTMSELPSELSTRVGAQVENKFAVILERLHIVFAPNKVLKRLDGQWNEAPELEVFFAQRRIIADALHEFSNSDDELLRTRAREVANVASCDYSEYLLGRVRAARNHHRNLERSVMESPPPCREEVLEIDFFIRPQSLNPARDDLPEIPVRMMKADPSGTSMVNWHDIVEQCRSGAFIEVTSAGWEKHGKLQSTRLTKMHEAREQWFQAGHVLYFYNGYSGNLAGISNPRICVYWYCKDDLLNVEKNMLESDIKKLEAENKALRSQGLVLTFITQTWDVVDLMFALSVKSQETF